jgi:hypothetical protein
MTQTLTCTRTSLQRSVATAQVQRMRTLGEARGRPWRLLTHRSKVGMRLGNAIEGNAECGSWRRREHRQSRQRGCPGTLRERTRRIRVTMAPRMIVSHRAVIGMLVERVVVTGVLMHRRTGVGIAQDNGQPAIDRRQHETGGNERTQQQHRKHKQVERVPRVPAACVPCKWLRRMPSASHAGTMHQLGYVIKAQEPPSPHRPRAGPRWPFRSPSAPIR